MDQIKKFEETFKPAPRDPAKDLILIDPWELMFISIFQTSLVFSGTILLLKMGYIILEQLDNTSIILIFLSAWAALVAAKIQRKRKNIDYTQRVKLGSIYNPGPRARI